MMGHFQVSWVLTPPIVEAAQWKLSKLVNTTLLTRELELVQFETPIKLSNPLELLASKIMPLNSFVACCKTMTSTDESRTFGVLRHTKNLSLLCVYTKSHKPSLVVPFAVCFGSLSIILWSAVWSAWQHLAESEQRTLHTSTTSHITIIKHQWPNSVNGNTCPCHNTASSIIS